RREMYFSKLLTADHPSRIVTIEARNATRPPMPASTRKSLLDTMGTWLVFSNRLQEEMISLEPAKTAMKKTKFTEAQIIGILKEQESGLKVSDICRKHGISDATFYNWKSKYAGMSVDELKRLKELEQENARLKKIVANQSLEIDIIKDVLSK